MRFRSVAALTLVLAAACTDDNDDGKVSEVVRGQVDAGPADAGPDGPFDQDSAELRLTCKTAVLSETEASGFLVKVTDSEGRVPGGKGLWVRLNPSTGTVSAAKAGGAETDANGEVRFSYVAPHFDFTTTIMLEASVIGEMDKVLAKQQCSFKVVTEALRFSEPAKDSFVRAGRTTPVALEVLLDDVPRSCDNEGGLKLTLTGPSGAGLAQAEDGPFQRELCVDLIDEGRAAAVLLRGGTNGGSGRLRASMGGVSTELSLKFVGQVNALQLTADATELSVGSGANIAITTIDDIGQPVPGVALDLELTRCAATGCSGDESLKPENATTDMNGKASAAYFAGDRSGAAQITATVKATPAIQESLIIRVENPAP